jgi:plasmid stabilization system protein ParE
VRDIVVLAEAEAEATDAYSWYESQRVGLGDQFLVAVRETIGFIQETPLAFPVADRRARRARVFGFPYSVYFEDRGNCIVVLAVFHARRHPHHWRRRE